MVENEPQVGQSHARCPHCRTSNDFDEYSLFINEQDKYSPLLVKHDGVASFYTVQVCHGCSRQILFIDVNMVFPYLRLPNVSFLQLPANLREVALSSYQYIDSTPALTAAALRHVLEELCLLKGMPSGDGVTYVSFLEDKLRSATLIGSLRATCKQGKEVIATDRIRWKDDVACVIVLAYLLDQAANIL